jgi:hypothetical protein
MTTPEKRRQRTRPAISGWTWWWSGGSQAGLAMAWHLARQGLRFVVLEAGP